LLQLTSDTLAIRPPRRIRTRLPAAVRPGRHAASRA